MGGVHAGVSRGRHALLLEKKGVAVVDTEASSSLASLEQVGCTDRMRGGRRIHLLLALVI